MERCSPTCDGILCNECFGDVFPEVPASSVGSETRMLAQRLANVEDTCRALLASRIAETQELKRLFQLLQRPQNATQSLVGPNMVPTEISEVTFQPNSMSTEAPKRLLLTVNQIVALKKSVAEGFPTDTLKNVFGCGPGTSSDAWCLARCVDESASGVAFTVVLETGKNTKKLTEDVVILDLEYRQARRNKVSGETFFRLKRIGFGRPDPTSGIIKTSRKSVFDEGKEPESEWVLFRVQENSSPQMSTPQMKVLQPNSKEKSHELRKQMREEEADKGDLDRTALSSPSSSPRKKQHRTESDYMLPTSMEFKQQPSRSRMLEQVEREAQANPETERTLRSSTSNNNQ